MLPISSDLLPFPGQMRREGHLKSASLPGRLSSSGRALIVDSFIEVSRGTKRVSCGFHVDNVRFTRKADIVQCDRHVRFVPKADILRCGKRRRYSMTSSAVASNDEGMVRPSALAVLRLITNSNLTGAWTGSSLGFS